MNAVARAQLTFQMLPLLQKHVCEMSWAKFKVTTYHKHTRGHKCAKITSSVPLAKLFVGTDTWNTLTHLAYPQAFYVATVQPRRIFFFQKQSNTILWNKQILLCLHLSIHFQTQFDTIRLDLYPTSLPSLLASSHFRLKCTPPPAPHSHTHTRRTESGRRHLLVS